MKNRRNLITLLLCTTILISFLMPTTFAKTRESHSLGIPSLLTDVIINNVNLEDNYMELEIEAQAGNATVKINSRGNLYFTPNELNPDVIVYLPETILQSDYSIKHLSIEQELDACQINADNAEMLGESVLRLAISSNITNDIFYAELPTPTVLSYSLLNLYAKTPNETEKDEVYRVE